MPIPIQPNRLSRVIEIQRMALDLPRPDWGWVLKATLSTNERIHLHEGLNGRHRYTCSTYKNSQGSNYWHNWVWRDDVVWYIIHKIQMMLSEVKDRKTLTASIRKMMGTQQVLRKSANKDVDKIRADRDRAKQHAKEAYRDKIEAKSEIEREIAQEEYEKRIAKVNVLDKTIKSLQEDASLRELDIEGEVESTISILEELHLFLGKIRDNRLREAFSALGIRMTVWFEKVPYGKNREKTVPVRGEIILGKNGVIRMPDGVNTLTTPKTSKSRKPKQDNKKRAAGKKSNGTLLKDGRGDRI
ncbi:MAG: hypothetical protein JXR97_13530 [Planctomycetes bacterium]|nr:hypothetical protein [Planctomycetota bacterium]